MSTVKINQVNQEARTNEVFKTMRENLGWSNNKNFETRR